LNYRHAFHAGNFADLVKHAALLRLLSGLTASGDPLTVIDTHAGRGLYDLAGPEARKSGEAGYRRTSPPRLSAKTERVSGANSVGASLACMSLTIPASASPDFLASGPARS